MDVIAIFDIGKNLHKLLLFDKWLHVVHTEEQIPAGISDNEVFSAEETAATEAWMRSCLDAVAREGKFNIKALNYSSTGSGLLLPGPGGYDIKYGMGMTRSSAALLPYLKGTKEHFIIISAGTWCIFINPFNTEPLSAEQHHDEIPYDISGGQRQVKSSRFLLGPVHDKNVDRLNNYFGILDELYKTIKIRDLKIWKLFANKQGRVFFREGIPADYVDNVVDLSQFLTFADAYHQMMFDLVDVCMESLRLISPADDETEVVYITGGFARNDTFVRLMATRLPGKRVFTSDISDHSALGAAMTVYESAFGKEIPHVYLGLRAVL